MSNETFIDPLRCTREIVPTDNAGYSVQAAFEWAVEKSGKEKSRRATGIYHPSAIAGCRRALFYCRVNTEEKSANPVDSQLIFDEGHLLHGYIQRMLKNEHGDAAAIEVKAKFAPLYIEGSIDAIINDWIIEIKTMGAASFSSLVRPNKEHIMQAHCYMYSKDIPRAQFLYVCRDNFARKMFKIRFNNDTWDTVLRIMSFVESFVAKNEPPPREENLFWCRTCKYAHICKPSIL